ncbi:hypothetical protein CEXT_759431 [Caerostris extrusa]|uniref:Uncharacterized protein n=1 Tax=Caerostris extrusa TaxID=172846 RepID=A0AAV4PHA0_CAEEX|nr:hypothetical protein CEXT_759431 [Caerostris extrusa]
MSDGSGWVFRQRCNVIRAADNGSLISSVKFDHRSCFKGCPSAEVLLGYVHSSSPPLGRVPSPPLPLSMPFRRDL